MLESFNTDKFEYKRLSLEEQKSRGILGRLVGVIADTKAPTRNGRKYSAELWEKVFENPIMQEKIKNRCCFGECGHPTDREETDMTKIAICLAEQPKKGQDGKLYGVFDILNTPNGKILKSLCDYGCNIGISSRGSGDLITDYDGNESVDPETYNCEGWDAVLIPAVETARLQYVTESLDTKKRNKTLRQKLTEELESASEEDRAVMEDALDSLDIKLDTEEPEEEEIPEEELSPEEIFKNTLNNLETETDSLYIYINDNEVDDEVVEKLHKVIDKLSDTLNLLEPQEDNEVIDTKPTEEVVDDMSDEVTAELQEALLKIKTLEEDNLSLQEKLSVCDAKEIKFEEDIQKYKNAMVSLSESAKKSKNLNDRVKTLTEALNKKDKLLTSNKSRLSEALESRTTSSKQLNEATEKVKNLETELTSLNEELSKKTNEADNYKSKVIKLQKALKESKELYIKTKAESYNLDYEDVKSKLTESYTTKDVTSVCEKLSEQRRNLNSLPFKINGRVAIKEAKTSGDYISNDIVNTDDEITDTLLSLIN